MLYVFLYLKRYRKISLQITNFPTRDFLNDLYFLGLLGDSIMMNKCFNITIDKRLSDVEWPLYNPHLAAIWPDSFHVNLFKPIKTYQ